MWCSCLACSKTLAVPSVQGYRLPQMQELGPYQSVGFFIFIYFIYYYYYFFFEPLVAGSSKTSLTSFSIVLCSQALRGLLFLGAFSAVQSVRHIEGTLWLEHYSVYWCISCLEAPRVGSYSVVQCVWCLMGQPLYCSAEDAGMWGERDSGDGSTRLTWLSCIILLPWLPGFSPWAFPTTIFSLTFPRSVSPQSTAALVLGLPHNP